MMLGEFKDEYNEKFDKILLDVPCLGFGVMKRKPDIKWQRKQEDLEKISKIQFAILNQCSKYLKIGGELVYSTCSILRSENENIIEEWLKAVHVEQCRIYKKQFEEKILPNKNSDGFFICKIRRMS